MGQKFGSSNKKIFQSYHYSLSPSTFRRYWRRKSFTSSLSPVVKSIPFRIIPAPTHRQLIKKKKSVCRWKPWAWLISSWLYLKAPPTKGNTPRARFCSISIIPNPVPSNLGGTSMGTVGTIMVQKMAMQIPNRKEGIHLTNYASLRLGVDSTNTMKM